jgi:hypothetical protein
VSLKRCRPRSDGRSGSSHEPRTFVQEPDALVAVGDELRRIREGRGADHELEQDDETWAIDDNAWRLAAKLHVARRELDEREPEEPDLFTAERPVEASLRYR